MNELEARLLIAGNKFIAFFIVAADLNVNNTGIKHALKLLNGGIS